MCVRIACISVVNMMRALDDPIRIHWDGGGWYSESDISFGCVFLCHVYSHSVEIIWVGVVVCNQPILLNSVFGMQRFAAIPGGNKLMCYESSRIVVSPFTMFYVYLVLDTCFEDKSMYMNVHIRICHCTHIYMCLHAHMIVEQSCSECFYELSMNAFMKLMSNG